VVYPALTYLEEAGFVTSTAEGNKRLYAITEEGKAHLADNRAAVETTLEHLARIGEQVNRARTYWREAERSHDHDMDDVAPEVNEARRELKQAIKQAARNRDPDAQRKLAGILRRAAEEIRRESDAGSDADIDI
jgi:DNA-binding PadR family transcriptional regulator